MLLKNVEVKHKSNDQQIAVLISSLQEKVKLLPMFFQRQLERRELHSFLQKETRQQFLDMDKVKNLCFLLKH